MNRKLFIIFSLCIALLLVNSSFSFAQNGIMYEESTRVIPVSPTPILQQNFKSVYGLTLPAINIPTVIEIDLKRRDTQESLWAVVNNNNELQPFVIVRNTRGTPFTVSSSKAPNVSSRISSLYDNDSVTYTEFQPNDIDSSEKSEVSLRIAYDEPITTSAFIFGVDRNIQLPERISIRYKDELEEDFTISLIDVPVTGNNIPFPRTTSNLFEVAFTYSQPLRITEVAFIEESTTQNQYAYLRFLARPGETYKLYGDPDVPVVPVNTEAGNLRSATEVITIPIYDPTPNASYIPSDRDRDSISDQQDNCPSVSNPDQTDVNNNGQGDACEDFDLDGIMNNTDNCPDHPNRLQQDEDGDGYGNHCDPEESRLIERLWWLPWLGIGVGFAIVITLLVTTVKHPTGRNRKTQKDSANQ
ncbi:thrombospondin type 3 repeat-containing protein [Candidatus Roizmanbacteria bacterium]|nr:thrombospondin type 3 repeat-containing protein [Candidatus Roizmanbacteria bacterium]